MKPCFSLQSRDSGKYYRPPLSPYSQGSPGNTIEALSLLTVESHREILYKYSLGWFMDPLWFHTCFPGSIHTLLVQYALSWIHTHLPPFSAWLRISSIRYSRFGSGCKIMGFFRSVSFSASLYSTQLATLQVHTESYLKALVVTQSSEISSR
jgi:hypothetical protein